MQVTTSYFNPLAQKILKPKENRDYKIIPQVLTSEEREKLSELARKALPIPIDEQEGNREVILSSMYKVKLKFSDLHSLERPESSLLAQGIQDPFLQKVYVKLLNTFAETWQLQGTFKVTLQITRWFTESGVGLNQDWHFDVDMSKSMVTVLHNDFDYAKGVKGLDLAFNGIPGPHKPENYIGSEFVSPREGSEISLVYPEKGALTWQNRKGDIVHRMSALAPKTFSEKKGKTPYRITVFVGIKDPHW